MTYKLSSYSTWEDLIRHHGLKVKETVEYCWRVSFILHGEYGDVYFAEVPSFGWVYTIEGKKDV